VIRYTHPIHDDIMVSRAFFINATTRPGDLVIFCDSLFDELQRRCPLN